MRSTNKNDLLGTHRYTHIQQKSLAAARQKESGNKLYKELKKTKKKFDGNKSNHIVEIVHSMKNVRTLIPLKNNLATGARARVREIDNNNNKQ